MNSALALSESGVMQLAYLSTDPGVAYGGTVGAAVHMEELTSALAAAGAEVLLLVAVREEGATPPPGVTIEELPGPGRRAPTSDRLAEELERIAWLQGRLTRFGAEALYERLALHSAAGAVAARALQIPHVLELNAPLVEEAGRYRGPDPPMDVDRHERETLAGATVVLAVSQPLARYAHTRGARRVEVLPNAVAYERFQGVARRDEGPIVAVFAGSLRPWHGIDAIAEAWTRLGEVAPELLVVGEGEGRYLLEACGARVTGSVPHSRVPGLLAQAHIGLALYAEDAADHFSPLMLFEYLAAGLATVATDLPGVRDVVTDDAAVLVPKGDVPALADAVATLAADGALRRKLGDAGRALVAERHTWGHRAHTILDLTAELVEEPGKLGSSRVA